MRNSFSLSVYFLVGCKCDVKIVYKIKETASKMKLVSLLLFISIANVNSNEHFTFPPKFHSPNSGIMLSSDSSIYLPPESHTSAPYYPMKNVNNLPFPYLPHTGTKPPIIHPSPYPLVISSTLLPIHDDEDDNEKDEKQPPPFQFQRNNRTERRWTDKIEPREMERREMERREMRPKPVNYQPIDRIDMKPPFGFFHPQQQNNPLQPKASPRSSVIISAEPQRNDAMDHLRAAASYQGPQYLPAPNAPGVYISSTTETAVPILRLSNEMDLDGSFSYEALGADQTHYVQHSRMENTGTDKEEQVVEGSYSYVGDNGQTYTVHYVADSKGFRASGDHLPVAPPIPEIIQRAVQFNLAEEAKRPPNQKMWNEENEVSESEKYHRFAMPPSSRPLFTGKTPESFSFGFTQGAYNAPNLTPAASTQNPIRINNEFTQDQIKGITNNANNAGTISPQITFLASQGAHVPGPNTQQQSISRVFTTERTILPQIVNYEAAVKNERTQDDSENKGLWRWQYGLNANVNQNSEKNTISRSSGADDDVMINFGEMTADQYTKMLKSQLEPNMDAIQNDQISQPSSEMKIYKEPNHSTKVQNTIQPDPKLAIESTENSFISTQKPNSQKNNNYNTFEQSNNYKSPDYFESKHNQETLYNARAKLITQNNFVPQSQMVTKSYDYENSSYEPQRVSRSSTTKAPEAASYYNYNNMNNYEQETQNVLWSTPNQIENVHKISTTEAPMATTTERSLKFTDFVMNEDKNDFKPILPSHSIEIVEEQTTSTTTESIENIFENNMFLKNLFNSNKNDQYTGNKIKEDNKSYQQAKIHPERKPDKAPKFIQMQAKPHNDVKVMPNKPLDLLDIMNYISAKNHFESIKVKPKSKYGSNNYHHRSEVRFIPVQNDQENTEDNDDEGENVDQQPSNHRTSYHPEELRGIIKNYKVLQRNNSAFKNGQDYDQLKRDLSPPPAKMPSNLPPLGRAGPSLKSYLPPIYV